MLMESPPISVLPALPEAVFQAISGRLRDRAADLARLVATGHVFEDWLSWETYLACAAVEGWSLTPRPGYSALGVKSSLHNGDLLVKDAATQTQVLVEVSHVHDFTGGKWADRLEIEAQLLRGPFLPGIVPLHVIVCASAVDIATDDTWQQALANAPPWNRPDASELRFRLLPRGTAIVRGWA